jgi:uncharacterized membrane protein
MSSSSCGSEQNQDAAFCGACDASCIPGVVTGRDAFASPGNTPNRAAASDAKTELSTNVAGALSYLLGVVSGILFLVIGPYRSDRFVRFHAFQSILFTIGWIGFCIAWTTITMVFEAITGGFLAFLIIPVDCTLTLAVVGYWVFLMYRAYSGQRHVIPVLGRMAERRASR